MRKRFVAFLCILLGTVLCFSSGAVLRAESLADVEKQINSLPVDWPTAPELQAGAAILIDASSGEILYAKNATAKMFPASTTKLMTALLSLERGSGNDIVPFSARAVNIPAGSSHIAMKKNEKMTFRECLYALLLPSANEVANALAEFTGGTISEFITMMNERAIALGAVNTHFANANGLHNDNHYTCAYDLALMMKECIKNETFVTVSSALSYVHHADELLPKDIPMTNTNLMIRSTSEYYNPQVVCGKTGHTAEGGYNLVTYARKDGMELIAVVMGCKDGNQYASTQSILDYGFHSFHQVSPAEIDDSLRTNTRFTASALAIPTPDVSLLTLNASDTILLPENVNFEFLTRRVDWAENGKRIVYHYRDYPLGSVLLTYEGETTKAAFLKEKEIEPPAPEPASLIVIDGFLLGFLLLLAALTTVAYYLIRRIINPMGELHHHRNVRNML